MALAGIKDVARRAGVSPGTVSNVLNRPSLVAGSTRSRVLDAIQELGYIRNEPARQLRAGRSRIVAIVVLDIANPFFTDVIRGTEAAVEATGASLVVCNSGADVHRERRHLDLLEERRVQGVLITPIDSGRNGHLDDLVRRGTPVVLVDRGSGRPDSCSVAVDDVLGGRLAGEHLRAQGHNRVAFVDGAISFKQVADRWAGFESVMDGGVQRVMVNGNLTVAAGREAGAKIVGRASSARPTAVFCANDQMALGVLREMTRHGLRVPDDIAIVGYDDISFAAAAAVPLSSVRQPREQLGRSAAELLLEEVNEPGRHEHRHVIFKPELVIRESSLPAVHRRPGGQSGRAQRPPESSAARTAQLSR